MKRVFFLFIVSILLQACNEYVPKPIGYNRIERTDSTYKLFDYSPFVFEYSNAAYIDSVYVDNKKDTWFNIVYPEHSVRIYCTYIPMEGTSLGELIEDSYQLAYSHSIKADGIRQTTYSNPDFHVGGVVYDLEGAVATPVQFFLTDSISNFFRASFYYDRKVKPDSVAPVTDFVKEDIFHLIDSFRWK